MAQIATTLSSLVLAVLWSTPQDKPLTGEAREEFMAAVGKSMGKVQTVVAGFVQEKHISLFDDVIETEGCILYTGPDKLRWEIRKPFRSILIVSGDAVAKFEFQKGERRRLELGGSRDIILIVMDQIRSWFRGDFENSDETYTVSVFDTAPARIVLRPKTAEIQQDLEAIELHLSEDRSAMDQVIIREKGGDKTVMRFRRVTGETDLSDDYYDVVNPRDLDPRLLRSTKDK